MQLFCLIVLALVITFVNGRAAPIQSQECTFTKSKQHSCLYFVIREDKDHAEAADYCFSEFNGGLPGIYESYEEAEEVMKRYFWWSKSNMSIPRFRFGATRRYPRLPYIYDYTYYNPLDHDGVAVDMDIWNRSFPENRNVTLDKALYDLTFDENDVFGTGYNKDFQYMSLKPQPHENHFNWSNANFVRKIPFICEVPRFPKAFCAPDWSLHIKSRSCFFISTLELNFHNAAMKCRDLGANLASINDATENDLALKMMEKVDKSKHVWFGLRWNAALSNDSAIPLKTPYDKFYKYFVDKMAYNVDGTPVTYFQDFDKKTQQPDGWKQTSPGTITVENCVLCEADTRKWHDYNCDTTTGFSLCRKMASTQPD